jgi:hypothetical protein
MIRAAALRSSADHPHAEVGSKDCREIDDAHVARGPLGQRDWRPMKETERISDALR